MLKNRWPAGLAASLALLTLAFPAFSRVQAADKTLAVDPCSFASKFAQLRAIQADGSQDYIDAIRSQLAVRKSILKSVIDCALKDVTARKTALDNVAPELKDAKVSERIAQGLDQSADFYATKRGIIDNLGIKGTQDVAREIANWRASNYAPIASQEDSLLLWSKNQPLFDRAASRLDQLKPVVLSLKLVNQDDLQSQFKAAESDLKKAEDENQAAKAAIENGDASAPETIKSSLEPLSTMYKKFLDLSDALKKLVP
jgi:hypothetical protein